MPTLNSGGPPPGAAPRPHGRRGGNNAVSAQVIMRIWQQREAHALSTRALADRVTKVGGYPITGQAISTHETQPGARLPVDYVFAAAKALWLSPAALMGIAAACSTCKGKPPQGYTCNACGARNDTTPRSPDDT